MELSSSAFSSGSPVPRRHWCEGEDLSPPLEWRGVLEDADSLALIVEDPDAPAGTFTHWLAGGIDPDAARRAEGKRPPGEGRNDFGVVGWQGPCPRRGHRPHRCFFRLYALGRELAAASGTARRGLECAIDGSVMEVAELVGGYPQ